MYVFLGSQPLTRHPRSQRLLTVRVRRFGRRSRRVRGRGRSRTAELRKCHSFAFRARLPATYSYSRVRLRRRSTLMLNKSLCANRLLIYGTIAIMALQILIVDCFSLRSNCKGTQIYYVLSGFIVSVQNTIFHYRRYHNIS